MWGAEAWGEAPWGAVVDQVAAGPAPALPAVVVGILVAIVTLQPRFDFGLELGEFRVQLVAVLGVDLVAQRLIARGKAQAFNGVAFELTFEA